MSESKCTPFSQQLAYINKGTLDQELTKVLAEVIKMVRETGKKKITKSVAQPQFSAKKARRMLELLFDAVPIVQGDTDSLMLAKGVKDEVMQIINDYRNEGHQQ